jgi:uncharacterized protein (TIGR03790 family)
MSNIFRLLTVLAWLASDAILLCAQGNSVIVVYNKNISESKQVADYYAERRQVPAAQVIGLDLPKSETITRKEYQEQLQKPLLVALQKARFMAFPSETGSKRKKGEWTPVLPSSATIRYAALCYGVPLRIQHDPTLENDSVVKIAPALVRNDAAIDSELALLPLVPSDYPLTGLFLNGGYAATNTASLHPTNGVLMVSRLDGPSAEIAKRLVDQALAAEKFGLWGRAYFDARGIAEGENKVGDEWIHGASEVTKRFGFETILDDKEDRFSVSFPMSQIAFYAGWYEYNGKVSGPFTLPQVEFMPGAFAYHLHSFSAQTVRSASEAWVGPLLDKGVTITMGSVYEPFLQFTPNVGMFLHRFLHLGFSFGEAAYASQSYLSWQIAVVGDPLYRPFSRKPPVIHGDLARTRDKHIEWSHLGVVNINLSTDFPVPDLVQYLTRIPETKGSAVLSEKLGDLYRLQKLNDAAAQAYRHALRLETSHQQRVRLNLTLAELLESNGEVEEAYKVYQEFARTFTDYPDMPSIYRKLISLAEKLKKTEDKERYEREAISPPSASSPATKS